nr:immunoglobulin light chain junction region [Macaca mulatta]
CLQGYTTPFSF